MLRKLFCLIFILTISIFANNSQNDLSLYFSARAQFANAPSVGEIGVIIDNLFISIDGGASLGFFGISYGGGSNVGAILPNNSERVKFILGLSMGYWILEGLAFRNVSSRYNQLFGGPFSKIIWGRRNVRFEISNRTLLGESVKHQFGFGISVIPRIK